MHRNTQRLRISRISSTSIAIFFALVIFASPAVAQTWMYGKWRVFLEDTNLDGWISIGVNPRTQRVIGITGNWGPQPRRGNLFRRGIDEMISVTYIGATHQTLEFDFISRYSVSPIPRRDNRILREGTVYVERYDYDTMIGNIHFAGDEPQGIEFIRIGY